MFVNKCYVLVLMFRCGTVAAHQMTKQDERRKEKSDKNPEVRASMWVRLLLQSKVKVGFCPEISSPRALVSLHCLSSLS
jgi:hypothetical protein